MLGSTAAPPPSSRQDCAARIVDGDGAPLAPPSHAKEDAPPSLTSPTEADLSSPSTSAKAQAASGRAQDPLQGDSFLSSKNKGHVPSEEIAQAAGDSSTKDSLQVGISSPSTSARPASSRPLQAPVQAAAAAPVCVPRPSHDAKAGVSSPSNSARLVSSRHVLFSKSPTEAGVSSPSKSAQPASSLRPFFSSKKNDLPGQVAAATKGRPQDPLQGEKKRPQKAPSNNRLRSPVVPVVRSVRSPGVNLMLSQTSPKSIGVKRASSTPSQTPSLSRRIKRRKLKSEIWNDFDPVYDGNKLIEARCKHCMRVYVATREAGTSQCIRHLLVCEERAKINHFLDSVKSATSQSDKNISEKWIYDPARAHWELVRMIVLHELPFRIVEYVGFRRFVYSLNPTFEMVCRTTIRDDCVNMFKEQKIKLQGFLESLKSRVSLTADMWTSSQMVSYMCITCHYLNEKWILRKKVIWFSEAETPHDGTNLFNIMLECMQVWGLQKKIFSITLDNASNNNKCVNYMKANLLGKNLLPCKGVLLHGRCAAHVINLIVQDGLAITCMAVDNIRRKMILTY